MLGADSSYQPVFKKLSLILHQMHVAMFVKCFFSSKIQYHATYNKAEVAEQ